MKASLNFFWDIRILVLQKYNSEEFEKLYRPALEGLNL